MDNPIPFRGKITRDIFGLIQSINAVFMHNISTIVPAVLVVYGIFIWAVRRELQYLVVLVGLGIGIFALRKVIQKAQISLSYEKYSYESNDFFGELNPYGVLLKDDQGDLELPWSEFTRFKTGPGLLLLYTAKGTFHVLHRSYFDSEQAWADAGKLVKDRVAQRP